MPEGDRRRAQGGPSSSHEDDAEARAERARAATSWRRDFARFGGLGLQLAAVVGIFAYLGLRLDRWLGTSPLFLLVGVFLGFGGGFFALLAKVARAGSSRERGTNPSQTER